MNLRRGHADRAMAYTSGTYSTPTVWAGWIEGPDWIVFVGTDGTTTTIPKGAA